MNKKTIYLICEVVLLALICVSIYFIAKDHQKKSDIAKTEKPLENVYAISDDSLGLTFEIDKVFSRIGQKELTEKSPYFVYGYNVKDVTEVACYISQTKRDKPGKISTEYLKNGTFEQIKSNYSDVVLDDWEEINLGTDDKGVKLNIKYKDNDKNMRLIEAVGTTNERTTFSFCFCPESLYEFYQSKFDQFFDSLRLD